MTSNEGHSWWSCEDLLRSLDTQRIPPPRLRELRQVSYLLFSTPRLCKLSHSRHTFCAVLDIAEHARRECDSWRALLSIQATFSYSALGSSLWFLRSQLSPRFSREKPLSLSPVPARLGYAQCLNLTWAAMGCHRGLYHAHRLASQQPGGRVYLHCYIQLDIPPRHKRHRGPEGYDPGGWCVLFN